MIPVTLIMAMTADGKIAKNSTQLANWTSHEDKKLFVEISKQHGVIMMGENTFNTFPKPLPGRLNVVFTKQENPEEINEVKWVNGEPEKVLLELETLGYQSALLGGGATLNSLFLKNKLINEIILTVEPKIFGSGLSLFNEDLEAELKLISLEKLNEDTVMLKYKVIYS
ncbi:MAG: dihydrofolate reductase family protein [Patescibacteria group bacterium]|nr:dihydrofolate reductase family protein [Patescibacteria group bacterium]